MQFPPLSKIWSMVRHHCDMLRVVAERCHARVHAHRLGNSPSRVAANSTGVYGCITGLVRYHGSTSFLYETSTVGSPRLAERMTSILRTVCQRGLMPWARGRADDGTWTRRRWDEKLWSSAGRVETPRRAAPTHIPLTESSGETYPSPAPVMPVCECQRGELASELTSGLSRMRSGEQRAKACPCAMYA